MRRPAARQQYPAQEGRPGSSVCTLFRRRHDVGSEMMAQVETVQDRKSRVACGFEASKRRQGMRRRPTAQARTVQEACAGTRPRWRHVSNLTVVLELAYSPAFICYAASSKPRHGNDRRSSTRCGVAPSSLLIIATRNSYAGAEFASVGAQYPPGGGMTAAGAAAEGA